MLGRMTKEQMWLARVLAWRASGQSAVEFCEEAGLSVSALRAWSSRLGREGKVARSAMGRPPKSSKRGTEGTFARVIRTQATDSQTRQSATLSQSMVISVGRSHIALSAGFDAELLRSVVQALSEVES